MQVENILIEHFHRLMMSFATRKFIKMHSIEQISLGCCSIQVILKWLVQVIFAVSFNMQRCCGCIFVFKNCIVCLTVSHNE
jgi:ABC-type transport system involved in Fe-S cluster assembly fused permease/ATPase subunit